MFSGDALLRVPPKTICFVCSNGMSALERLNLMWVSYLGVSRYLCVWICVCVCVCLCACVFMCTCILKRNSSRKHTQIKYFLKFFISTGMKGDTLIVDVNELLSHQISGQEDFTNTGETTNTRLTCLNNKNWWVSIIINNEKITKLYAVHSSQYNAIEIRWC